MTALTQNLPWFVKDLGVSIVGEVCVSPLSSRQRSIVRQKCYSSIVENLNLNDVDCLKYCISKGLGIGIVVGGSIMKVPQLLLSASSLFSFADPVVHLGCAPVVSARSARGVSLVAYVLETLSYAITLAYSYRNEFPFSTYGENFFLTIQNIVITLLIVHYNPPASLVARSPVQRAVLSSQAMLACVAALVVAPASMLSLFQLATLPLSLFSKLPQIRQNHRAQSTGQLSAFAVIAQVGGCLARLFTTAAEVGDPIITAGFALALALNIVLGAQMWMYWGKDDKDEIEMGRIGVSDEKAKPQWSPPAHKVEVVVPPASPGGRASPRPSNRRWSRKVD